MVERFVEDADDSLFFDPLSKPELFPGVAVI